MNNLDTELPDLFKELTLLFVRSGEGKRTLPLLAGIQQLKPESQRTQFLEGMVYSANDIYAEAEKSYRKLLEDEPENEGIRVFLAETLIKQEKWDEGKQIIVDVLDSTDDESVRAFAQELQDKLVTGAV